MPVPTIDRPVSALRQRMLEDMAMRGLRSDTQHEYIRFVRSFAAFLRQPPDTATAEDIRRFQVHQRESGVQPGRFSYADPVPRRAAYDGRRPKTFTKKPTPGGAGSYARPFAKGVIKPVPGGSA